jgi:thioester reductase-like protein
VSTLLTGATGFVGGEVLARLLEDTDREVVALVRGPDGAGRLRAVLARLDLEGEAGRVQAVEGDVTEPEMGLDAAAGDALAARLDAVVHCAASVSFALALPESRAINVEGTRRVLELAARAPSLERFVHVSTAYVAGTHAGAFEETDLDVGQGFRNPYEQSKAEAERLVRARSDLPVSVVRPSIVVGDSRTGWTSAFNVVYFPLQAFARGLTDAVPADPEALVDIVGVDHVADGILAALEAPQPIPTLHLVAGDRAARVAELAELAARYFDRPPPRLNPPGTAADPSLDQFVPYFSVRARFGDAAARSLGLRAAPLEACFDRLMDFAVAARWGRRDLPRPRAAAVAPTI